MTNDEGEMTNDPAERERKNSKIPNSKGRLVGYLKFGFSFVINH